MNLRRGFVLTIVLCSSLPAFVSSHAKTKDPLEQALHEKFPEAPQTLDSEPGGTGILVVQTDITKGGGFKVTGAMLERRRDRELIRASRFERNLILFYDLEPGPYRLILIKASQVFGGPYTFTRPRVGAPEVAIQRGTPRYLGVVEVHVRSIFNTTWEIAYSPATELDAWEQFKKRYVGSPWIRLVDERIASLGAGAKP